MRVRDRNLYLSLILEFDDVWKQSKGVRLVLEKAEAMQGMKGKRKTEQKAKC